jgi:hypothetical protein
MPGKVIDKLLTHYSPARGQKTSSGVRLAENGTYGTYGPMGPMGLMGPIARGTLASADDAPAHRAAPGGGGTGGSRDGL